MAVLDQFQVPNAERDELVLALLARRCAPEIVEAESAQTGTALPDSFEPAPPLTAFDSPAWRHSGRGPAAGAATAAPWLIECEGGLMARSMRDGLRPLRELPLQVEQIDSLDQVAGPLARAVERAAPDGSPSTRH